MLAYSYTKDPKFLRYARQKSLVTDFPLLSEASIERLEKVPNVYDLLAEGPKLSADERDAYVAKWLGSYGDEIDGLIAAVERVGPASLSPRETLALVHDNPAPQPNYRRFWQANPDAKDALYVGLLSDSAINAFTNRVLLIATIGDADDVPKLMKCLTLSGAKNMERTSVLCKAFAILGDRGFPEGYAALFEVAKEATDESLLLEIVRVFGNSKYPYLKDLLAMLVKRRLSDGFKKKLSSQAKELIRRQQENREGYLAKYHLPRMNNREAADWGSKLSHRKGPARLPSIIALESCGLDPTGVWPTMIRNIHPKTDLDILKASLIVVGEMNNIGKLSQVLRMVSKHEDSVVRAYTAIALGLTYHSSEGAAMNFRKLVDLIADKSALVRLYAITAIGLTKNSLPGDVSKELLRILSDEKTHAIEHKYHRIPEKQSPWPFSIPEVIRIAPQNSAPLKCAAAYALGRCGAEIPTDIVEKALKLDNRMLKVFLLENNSANWKGREELIPLLLPLLSDSDETLTVLACDALRAIGHPLPIISDVLSTQLSKGSDWRKLATVKALGSLGVGKKAIESLEKLSTKDVFLKNYADNAVRSINERLK